MEEELEFLRRSKIVTDQGYILIFIRIEQIMFFIFQPFPENLNVWQVQHIFLFRFRYFQLITLTGTHMYVQERQIRHVLCRPCRVPTKTIAILLQPKQTIIYCN